MQRDGRGLTDEARHTSSRQREAKHTRQQEAAYTRQNEPAYTRQHSTVHPQIQQEIARTKQNDTAEEMATSGGTASLQRTRSNIDELYYHDQAEMLSESVVGSRPATTKHTRSAAAAHTAATFSHPHSPVRSAPVSKVEDTLPAQVAPLFI